MYLTVDIGNSVISIALFNAGEIVDVFNRETPKALKETAQANFDTVRPIINEFKSNMRTVHLRKCLFLVLSRS